MIKNTPATPFRLRNRHFLLIDLNVFLITPFLSLIIRFDGNPDWGYYFRSIVCFTIFFGVVKVCTFLFFNLYHRYWRLASVDEMVHLIFIGFVIIIVELFLFGALRRAGNMIFLRLPFSMPFIDSNLTMIFVSMSRFSIRFIERARQRRQFVNRGCSNVLIAGAGMAGTMIVLEMQRNPDLNMHPVAFVDDDPSKHRMHILGIPVLGSIKNIPEVIDEYRIQKVIVAMPTAPGSTIRDILNDCHALGVETMTVPGIYEILNGRVTVDKIRKIQIEDLLRREPVKTDDEKVRSLLRGKRVLITGAGGSIGSELCRQVLSCNPEELVLLGHGENSIFEIEQELNDRKRIITDQEKITTTISARIADLRFKERLNAIFAEHDPELIFHAAAHKHVPLMESNPQEAVTNNILGIKNLVDLSIDYGVNHFIAISTDKAVNPTNIMGASKRITEMILLDAAGRTGRYFSAVRFGNVLGSRGSVVRTFQKQLLNGGPLTITHPDIIRYFMTIPEAVQLVLQASVLGKGGEVFVLDMGKPVRIMDLAKDIIRLAGYKEGIDISIKVTGLRPGEKLFEELFVKGEEYCKTAHEKILIARNSSKCIPGRLYPVLDRLLNPPRELTRREIIKYFCELIPEFQPDQALKGQAAGMKEMAGVKAGKSTDPGRR